MQGLVLAASVGCGWRLPLSICSDHLVVHKILGATIRTLPAVTPSGPCGPVLARLALVALVARVQSRPAHVGRAPAPLATTASLVEIVPRHSILSSLVEVNQAIKA